MENLEFDDRVINHADEGYYVYADTTEDGYIPRGVYLLESFSKKKDHSGGFQNGFVVIKHDEKYKFCHIKYLKRIK